LFPGIFHPGMKISDFLDKAMLLSKISQVVKKNKGINEE